MVNHWCGVVNGEEKHTTNLVASIQDSYDDNTTDEFIKPTVKVDSADQPIATIQDGDGASDTKPTLYLIWV